MSIYYYVMNEHDGYIYIYIGPTDLEMMQHSHVVPQRVVVGASQLLCKPVDVCMYAEVYVFFSLTSIQET